MSDEHDEHGQAAVPAGLPPKRGFVAPLLAVIFLATTGGAGFYAYKLHKKQRDVAAQLDESRHEVERTAAQTGREKERGDKAEAALSRCGHDRDKHAGARAENEKTASDARKALSATQAELENLRAQRAEAEARLKAFEMLTARFKKMIDAGTLKIVMRDGRMVVKLPESILFASGEAKLGKGGTASVHEIASVLRQLRDRQFMVAGHTDNVPAGGKFKNNWELSTARAVTVTEALVAGGMNPAKLVPAGYGPYEPIARNSSEAGRAENRRIEIVLLPKLQELPPLPGKDGATAAR